MRFEFRLPDIGEGMVEGEIVKWHAKAGDDLGEDQPVLDVMTDKATVTISAPKEGKLLEIHGKEGEIKKVGEILFVLEVAGAGTESSAPLAKSKEASPPKSNGGSRSQAPAAAGKVLATPATRRLAREMGVDIAQVVGSGKGGRVTNEDLTRVRVPVGSHAAAASAPAIRVPVTVAGGGEDRVPFRGLRRKIADKMTVSKTKAPHFTYVEECDATELVELRDKADPAAKAKGVRLTYLPFIMKAVVHGLKKYPMLNSVLDEERQEIIVKHYYNIGIGAATPDGLTVFVVKNADQKSILELGLEVSQLGDKARANKLTAEELSGSTFTITSLGALGGMFATPIINYPEVAILGIHRIQKRPVVREGQIAIRDMMYVSLSFDHRVIDGDVGARFANEVIERISHPSLALID